MDRSKINKSPAFQFYPGDWLASTKISLMTPAEEGAYLRLLCHAWSDPQCSLLDDDEILASLSRLGPEWFNGASTKIRSCFKKKGNKLYSERLEIEKKKQREWRKKSKLGGLNSAKSRKHKGLEGKGGSHLVETIDEPKGNIPSPSPSPSSSSLKEERIRESKQSFASRPLNFKSFLLLMEKTGITIDRDVIDSVQFFLNEYKKHIGKDHPLLKLAQWQAVINTIFVCEDEEGRYFDIESEILQSMIEGYFKIDFQEGCNYSILHFNSDGVKIRRMFEVGV